MKLAVIILTILLGLAVNAERQSFRNAAPSGDSRPAASPYLRKRNAIEGRQAQLRKTEDDATEVRQAAEANQTAGNQADPSKRLADTTIGTVGNKKYVFQSKTMDWYTARRMCMQQGGNLASFLSYAEFDRVTLKSQYYIHTYTMWVGARLHTRGTSDFTNNWYWVTGEPLSPYYNKWYNYGSTHMPSSGSTSSDCTYISSNGNMFDNGPSLYPAACGSKYYSLCEIPAKPTES